MSATTSRTTLNGSAQETAQGTNNIKVVCRFRPVNKVETANGFTQPIVSFEDTDTVKLESNDLKDSFTFDRVFGMESRQHEVFDYSIKSTVEDVLNGYNGTVFAYGQTGAGKSFTMMGASLENRDLRGVIPRIVEQVFSSIAIAPGNMEYTVKVSYMEIYMEKIRDLLQPANDNLPIHEEKTRGVYVKGLLEVYTSSTEEVYQVLEQGGQSRATSSTNMNAESSRSHSIFVVTVTQKNVETGSAKSGQLFLVDLAGSEKVGKTGASGQTLEEAKKINKSLSTLGMVINALTDGKSTHVPYRDSKLTRILQESLGGNSRTTLIINCSPSAYNDSETLSTLRFGMRAKSIKNKAKVNAELSPAELKAHLKRARQECLTFQEYASALEGELGQWRGGVQVKQEHWVTFRENGSSVLPSQSGSRVDVLRDTGSETPRASTPLPGSAPLEKDERDEFLKRENELQDALAAKESALARNEGLLARLQQELASLQVHDQETARQHALLSGQYRDAQMAMEKAAFEHREAAITLDSLKEANSDLTHELEEVKKALMQARLEAAVGSTTTSNDWLSQEEKEKRKAEKMRTMMAGFSIERDPASSLQDLLDTCTGVDQLDGEGLAQLRATLQETQRAVRDTDRGLQDKLDLVDSLTRRKAELEARLERTEQAYAALLEKTLAEQGVDMGALKQQYQEVVEAKREADTNEIARLHEQAASQAALLAQSQEALAHAKQQRSADVPVPYEGSNGGKTVAQQLADFDAMKKSLMRDLQTRCERVVELEIALDDTREQYNAVLRSTHARTQQKKMAFLERNLEQLTAVQRQLVEQNASLKKEVAIAERKLIARNERIASLEGLLQEAQDKLQQQHGKFEQQLQAVRERLESARTKAPAAQGIASQGMTAGMLGLFSGTKIAKPLRGGGLPDSPGGPQQQTMETKRGSWFRSGV
ncbi:P-loop containing nucleoside triphosphate hydrolase protein [Protomyces lactucae-debilis]|uniref:Kinesin-like protein n=1 Tax=Protomyces lactucae-debilis TaxID=2754530 RepID=A0A1Y2FND0_PROLT|nr:P-loop containing nucleoside triphosphate hydrolase protein [Protomyces lactucae-debilis]ORY85468.1 P-loop containing nucleoside triphosphate hydrolase protein [Protomyces lactucae-debilis]